MAPVSFLLLLVLCCAYPTTAAQSKHHTKDHEKPGDCPVPTTLCTAARPPSPTPPAGGCKKDMDCPGKEKCCIPLCTPKCTAPVSQEKPGKCPVVNIFAPCSTPAPPSQCSNDQQCDGDQKCCDYVCNFQCSEPYQ